MLIESMIIIKKPEEIRHITETLNKNNYRWGKAWLRKVKQIVNAGIRHDDPLYTETVNKFYKYLNKHGYAIAVEPEHLYKWLKEEN